MPARPHYSPPCTLEVRTLPDGATTRDGQPFRFQVYERDVIRVEIPGSWRGPDRADPSEPGQEAWLCSDPVRPHLRSVWSCIWETDQGGFGALLDLLADRLSAPSAEVQQALEKLRDGMYGDPKGTLVEVDELLARHPDLAELHFTRGRVLERLGDVPAARAAFDRCVECAPHHGEGWIRAGFTRLTTSELHHESLACHERAVALLPRSSSASYYLARQLARLDRLEEAQAEMARNIQLQEIAPPDSYMHRARWLHALGRRAEALEVLDSSEHQPEALLRLRLELADSAG